MIQTRRRWFHWLFGAGFTGSLGSFLYPVVRFISPPDIPEAPVHEVAAGKVQDLKLNSAKMVRFGSSPALLIRTSEDEWRAFSATCTHLDCTVQFRESDSNIWCACHNGLYDINGSVVSGPPPRPLEEFTVHVRGDEIFVARRV